MNNTTQKVNETEKKINELLSDPKITKAASIGKIKKNLAQAKELFETLRKILNYIQAVRPSYYGLYDFVYGPNDPAKAKEKALQKKKRRKMKRKLKKF